MNKKSIQANEAGMVAIVVTSVLMLVISIMVIGYTQAIRREQQSTLDNQLSTQAFYAAESGINLAEKEIKTGTVTLPKTSCAKTATELSYTIDTSTGSAITCLLINNTVSSVNYQSVGQQAKVANLQAAGGVNIGTVTFGWQNSSGTAFSCPSSYPNLPSSLANWNCSEPMLRVDVVPLGNGSGLTQGSLQAGQYTVFLDPTTGGTTSTPYSPASTNKLIATKCTSSATRCSITITGLNSQQVAVRVMSLYRKADIQISTTDTSGNAVSITGVQYVIDSTARAVDVVRRLQARVSLENGNAEDFAIQGDAGSAPARGGNDATICKQFTVWAGTVSGCGY